MPEEMTQPSNKTFKIVGWEASGGTNLQAEIYVTYQHLVKTFGEPSEGYDKTDAEWVLQFEDGTIATIYNWKNGPHYGGDELEDIIDWHIGGKSQDVVDTVVAILGPTCEIHARWPASAN